MADLSELHYLIEAELRNEETIFSLREWIQDKENLAKLLALLDEEREWAATSLAWNAKVEDLEARLRQTIQAIEDGQKNVDHRGTVYRQEFGEGFVRHLREALKSHGRQRR